MYRRILFHCGLVASIFLALCAASFVVAIPGITKAKPMDVAAKQGTDSGRVTILILDMSDSMQQNDPQAVRCSAANAYIDLSGSGDQIGVVALASTTADQTSSVWQEPTAVEVDTQRNQLKQIIAQRPQGEQSCKNPGGKTPTNDALKQALRMLNKAASGKDLQGSVILLSGGVPTPDPDGQEKAIREQLLPQFQQNHWPIDTIALGTDQSSQQARVLLHDLATNTGGISYDDAEGVIAGQASPLNMTSFFLDIFRQRVGGTVTPIVKEPQMLNGGTTSYNLTLDSHVKHLALVIPKEQGIIATLTSPGPIQEVLPSPQPIPNVFISSSDPNYEIFSIDGPKEGTWQLDIHGTGQFLASSLITSWLQISITSPPSDGALFDLAHSFMVVAIISDGRSPGDPVQTLGLDLVGTLTYPTVSANQPVVTRLSLERGNSPGQYQTSMMVPSGSLPGTYAINVSASGQTSAVISSTVRTVRLDHFPEPLLIVPETGEETTDSVKIREVRWDTWLSTIYTLPGVSLLSPLALQGTSVQLSGVTQWKGETYSGARVVKAVLQTTKGISIPIEVQNEANGHFQLQFPSLPDGTYTMTLSLDGTFKDVSGPLGTTQRGVQLTGATPSASMYLRAIAIICICGLLSVLLLIGLLWLFWFIRGPAPFGKCVLSRDGELYEYPFKEANRRVFMNVFSSTLYSEDVKVKSWSENIPVDLEKLPRGLKFRFRHKLKIKVYKTGPKGDYWLQKDQDVEQALPAKYCEVYCLIYRPQVGEAKLPSSEYTVRSSDE